MKVLYLYHKILIGFSGICSFILALENIRRPIYKSIFFQIAKKINYKYFNQDLSEKLNYLDYMIHPFENLQIKFKKKA
jgi:hypothetical protein